MQTLTLDITFEWYDIGPSYYAPASIDRVHIVFGLSICLSVRSYEADFVRLVSIGLHSVHLVGMGLELGISGVKKSTFVVALNKEHFIPTRSSLKDVRLFVCLQKL